MMQDTDELLGVTLDENERLRADNERLRGLLRVINAAPRHLEHGSYLVRLYHEDFERIAAVLGTADQPGDAP